MDAEDAFSKLSDEMEKLAWEARARITWGDSERKVRLWLIESGADSRTIKRILAVCLKERSRSLRIKGTRDLFLAGGLFLAAVGSVLGMHLGGAHEYLGMQISAFVWAVAFVTAMYGLHLAWRGASRLILGAKSKEADCD